MDLQGYNLFAFIALCAWVPIVLGMFAFLSPRRAVIAAFVCGYLFLPALSLHFPTIPDVNKGSLTAVGVILGSLIFDGGKLFAVRPRLIDLACVVLCFSPIETSLVNGLGIMDGFAASATLITRWGLAYWIGRAYFTDWEAARELAVGIVLGGVAYIPLCVWEIRMSPQLHGQIYGLTFMSFRQDSALYGFRPNVFLIDGLTVTMFMGVCSILALWMWMTQSPAKIWGVKIGWIALALIVTTVMCKALGGLALTVAGITALMMSRWPKTKFAAMALLIVPPFYIVTRANGQWNGDRLIEAAQMVSTERAKSLDFRLKNENMLVARALEQPWWGWGGWGRAHVYDPFDHRDLTIVDGLWILTFGEHGIIGLVALLLMVLGPAAMMLRRVPLRYWSDAACAAPVALAIVITLYMVDGLFNATFNSVSALAVGAVASMAYAARGAFKPQTQQPRHLVAQSVGVVSSIGDIPYVRTPARSQ
jgi:hypothetical protein